jgi:hypothetical protein
MQKNINKLLLKKNAHFAKNLMKITTILIITFNQQTYFIVVAHNINKRFSETFPNPSVSAKQVDHIGRIFADWANFRPLGDCLLWTVF